MPTDPIYTVLYNTAADKSSVFYCPFEIFPCVVKRYDPFSFKKKKMNGIIFSSALKRALSEVKG